MVLWFFYPETKKLSLEELDFLFAKKYGFNVSMKEVELENANKHDTEQIEVARQIQE